MSNRVLVIDDDLDDNSRYCRILRSYEYQVHQATTVEQAIRMIAEHYFDVILVDMRLPMQLDGARIFGGIEVIKRTRAHSYPTQVVAITGYGSRELAVDAMAAGAFDYITKDLETEARLPGVVHLAADRAKKLRDAPSSAGVAKVEPTTPGNVVANSEAMRVLLRQLTSMARVDPLLIIGERGVGKSLVASIVHSSGPRSTGPFEKVSCRGMSDDLVELWGHHANPDLGACHRAADGTLLLKDIEQLSPAQQSRILTFVTQRIYTPVGGATPLRGNLQLIATTSVDLPRLVSQGAFLEPLYAALKGATLRVPPLRERRDKDDIPALAGHILTRDSLALGLSPAAAAALAAYDYSEGNITELGQVLQSAAVQSGGALIEVEHLPPAVRKRGATSGGFQPAHPPDNVQLTLRFQTNGHEPAMVLWESYDNGTARSQFHPPFDAQDLALVLRALDAAQLQSAAAFSASEFARLQQLNLCNDRTIDGEIERRVGLMLYRALVADETAKVAIATARNSATTRNLSLALILRFPAEAVELAALPWELLRDERQALLLSRNKVSSCVRYIDLPNAVPPPPVAGRSLRLLAICPSAGLDAQHAAANQAELMSALKQVVAQQLVEVEQLTPTDRRTLTDRLQEGERVDILHFVGATTYQGQQPLLHFDDGTLSADRLASIVGDIPLIVLQASNTATLAHDTMSTAFAPVLSAEGVAAVVAMQAAISPAAGARFAAKLYANLARGEALQTAVARARQALYVEFPESWYVPVLYIRSRDLGPFLLFAPR